ncbi:hypothetical protein BGX24_007598, partial [Mortierella sp. AD032]
MLQRLRPQSTTIDRFNESAQVLVNKELNHRIVRSLIIKSSLRRLRLNYGTRPIIDPIIHLNYNLKHSESKVMQVVFDAESKLVEKEVDPQTAILKGIVVIAEVLSQQSLLE